MVYMPDIPAAGVQRFIWIYLLTMVYILCNMTCDMSYVICHMSYDTVVLTGVLLVLIN